MQKERFLQPLIEGRARSAFFMTEPAADGGAGSDPSMLKTTALAALSLLLVLYTTKIPGLKRVPGPLAA